MKMKSTDQTVISYFEDSKDVQPSCQYTNKPSQFEKEKNNSSQQQEKKLSGISLKEDIRGLLRQAMKKRSKSDSEAIG